MGDLKGPRCRCTPLPLQRNLKGTNTSMLRLLHTGLIIEPGGWKNKKITAKKTVSDLAAATVRAGLVNGLLVHALLFAAAATACLHKHPLQ